MKAVSLCLGKTLVSDRFWFLTYSDDADGDPFRFAASFRAGEGLRECLKLVTHPEVNLIVKERMIPDLVAGCRTCSGRRLWSADVRYLV